MHYAVVCPYCGNDLGLSGSGNCPKCGRAFQSLAPQLVEDENVSGGLPTQQISIPKNATTETGLGNAVSFAFSCSNCGMQATWSQSEIPEKCPDCGTRIKKRDLIEVADREPERKQVIPVAPLPIPQPTPAPMTGKKTNNISLIWQGQYAGHSITMTPEDSPKVFGLQGLGRDFISDRKVSRRHMKIYLSDDGTWMLKCLNGNGKVIVESRMLENEETIPLHNNDVVYMGRYDDSPEIVIKI